MPIEIYQQVKVVFFYVVTALKDKLCSIENKVEELKRENAGGVVRQQISVPLKATSLC